MPHPSLAELSSLRVVIGRAGSPSLSVGVPLLTGNEIEALFPAAEPAGQVGEFATFSSDEWLLGFAALPSGETLEENAKSLYRQLIRLTRKHHLARIWNYVPGINGSRADRLEHYQAFCSGRAAAFESEWGPGFKSQVPAASAVGSEGANLSVVFAATTQSTRHFENPIQMPAYDYPRQYGPRPPSFARATVVTRTDGMRDVFISGTAAIRGHATFTPGDTRGQLSCTLENLRAIGTACGLGEELPESSSASRSFKVYLRNAGDLDEVAARLKSELLRPSDQVSYLRADICRRDLNVEIEAAIFGA